MTSASDAGLRTRSAYVDGGATTRLNGARPAETRRWRGPVRGRPWKRRRDDSQTRFLPAALASGRVLGVAGEGVNPALEAAPLAGHQLGITERVREERDPLV